MPTLFNLKLLMGSRERNPIFFQCDPYLFTETSSSPVNFLYMLYNKDT